MTATATARSGTAQSNARSRYEVTAAELPLCCPLPGASLWNSHPRVYLSFGPDGSAKCPYCSAEFTLVP